MFCFSQETLASHDKVFNPFIHSIPVLCTLVSIQHCIYIGWHVINIQFPSYGRIPHLSSVSKDTEFQLRSQNIPAIEDSHKLTIEYWTFMLSLTRHNSSMKLMSYDAWPMKWGDRGANLIPYFNYTILICAINTFAQNTPSP